jgi:hypothetical protein
MKATNGLAVRRADLERLRLEAAGLHADAIAITEQISTDVMRALEKAWQCGKRLNAMKEILGHGNWLPYLESHLPEISVSTAQRYMKIDRENPNAARVRDLKFDSIRKHCLSLAPAKERLQLEGDSKINPGPHYLTFVNNFSKWDHHVQIGKAEMPPLELFRYDLERTLRRIAEIGGRDWFRKLSE